jgi:glycosyltransferase involved in cell wall biosynthesis
MRIGINTLYLIPGAYGGNEVYVRNLLIALQKIDSINEYIVFTNKEGSGTFRFENSNWREICCPVRAMVKPLRIIWEQLILPWQVRKNQLDLLHGVGYIVPLIFSCPSAVTIYDIGHIRFSQMFPPIEQMAWRTLVPRSARKASAILTISSSARDDIADAYKVDPHKIFVTPLAADGSFHPNVDGSQLINVKKRYMIDQRYILSVNQIKPNKNLEGLIRAFAKASKKLDLEYQLVLVGRVRDNDYYSLLSALVTDLGIKQKVIFTGHVPDEDLPKLYSAADLFIFPSFYEGFGIPAIEAMACGVPVILSNAPALPEVGGNAALYFDPNNVDQIAQSIYTVLSDDDLKVDLAAKSQIRAREFSWEKTARDTLDVYQAIAENRI